MANIFDYIGNLFKRNENLKTTKQVDTDPLYNDVKKTSGQKVSNQTKVVEERDPLYNDYYVDQKSNNLKNIENIVNQRGTTLSQDEVKNYQKQVENEKGALEIKNTLYNINKILEGKKKDTTKYGNVTLDKDATGNEVLDYSSQINEKQNILSNIDRLSGSDVPLTLEQEKLKNKTQKEINELKKKQEKADSIIRNPQQFTNLNESNKKDFEDFAANYDNAAEKALRLADKTATNTVGTAFKVYDTIKDLSNESGKRELERQLQNGEITQEQYERVKANWNDFDINDKKNVSQMVREHNDTVSNRIYAGLNDTEKFVVGAVDSNLQFLANYYVGGALGLGGNAITAIMATQSASDKYLDNRGMGYDAVTSGANAVLSGLLSYYSEHARVSNFLEGVLSTKTAQATLAAYLENTFAQAVSEGYEEALEAIVEPVIDKLTIIGTADANDLFNYLITEGWNAEEIFMATAQGAFGGALLGGVYGAQNLIQNRKQVNEANKAISLIDEELKTADNLDTRVLRNGKDVGSRKENLELAKKSLQTMIDMYEGSTLTGGAIKDASNETTPIDINNGARQFGTILQPTVDQVNNANTMYDEQAIKGMAIAQGMMKQSGINMPVEQFAQLTPEQRQNTVNIQKVADALGVEVYQDTNLQDNADGYIDEDNIIYVNPNGQDPIYKIFTHELTHSVENKERYNNLSNLLQEYDSKHTSKWLNTLQTASDEKGNRLYSDEQIKNGELTARLAGDLLGNKQFVDRLVKNNTSLAYRIYDSIKNITQKDNKLRQVENLFIETFRENNISVDEQGNTKYSKWVNVVDEFNKNGKTYGRQIIIDEDSKGLEFANINPNTPIHVNDSLLSKLKTLHPEINDDIIKNIGQYLKNNSVIAIDGFGKNEGRKAIILEITVADNSIKNKNNPVLVSIIINQKQGNIEVNDINSIYGKRDLQGYINNAYEHNAKIYTNEKSSKWLSANGYQLPNASNFTTNSKLTQKTNGVNNIDLLNSISNQDYDYWNNDLMAEAFGDDEIGEISATKINDFLSQFQTSIANKDNFYKDTFAIFDEVPIDNSTTIINYEPDYISKYGKGNISSVYWYTKDGVYRLSDHWGNKIRSCDWYLQNKNNRNNIDANDMKNYEEVKANPIYDLDDEGFETIETDKTEYTGGKLGFAKWDDFKFKNILETDSKNIHYSKPINNLDTEQVYVDEEAKQSNEYEYHSPEEINAKIYELEDNVIKAESFEDIDNARQELHNFVEQNKPYLDSVGYQELTDEDIINRQRSDNKTNIEDEFMISQESYEKMVKQNPQMKRIITNMKKAQQDFKNHVEEWFPNYYTMKEKYSKSGINKKTFNTALFEIYNTGTLFPETKIQIKKDIVDNVFGGFEEFYDANPTATNMMKELVDDTANTLEVEAKYQEDKKNLKSIANKANTIINSYTNPSKNYDSIFDAMKKVNELNNEIENTRKNREFKNNVLINKLKEKGKNTASIFKDITRNIETWANGDESLKQMLKNVVEVPFRKAQANNLSKKQYFQDFVNKTFVNRGIVGESKEAEAVQFLMEGHTNKLIDVENDPNNQQAYEPYDESIVKEQFNYDAKNGKKMYQNIIDAAKETRIMFDTTLQEYNDIAIGIYGDVEEENNVEAAKLRNKLKDDNAVVKMYAQDIIENGTDVKKQALYEDAVKKFNSDLKKYTALLKDVDTNDATRRQIIPYRQNYVHHIQKTPGFFENSLLNVKSNSNNNIPNEIAGMTDMLKAKSAFSTLMLKQGDSNYVGDIVSSVIDYGDKMSRLQSFTPVIDEYRQLVNQMRKADAGGTSLNKIIPYLDKFTNTLIGKRTNLDRMIDENIDGTALQKPYEFAQNISKAARKNSVVGNVRTTIVQFGNLPNGIGILTQNGGKETAIDVLKGAYDYFRNIRSGNSYDQNSAFMNSRYFDFNDGQNGWKQKGAAFLNWMLEFGDKQANKIIYNAAYEQALRKGLDTNAAYDYADDLTRQACAGRDIGDIPIGLQGKFVNMIAPFQVEVNNAWQSMKGYVKEKEFAAMLATIIGSWLFNQFTEAVFGDRVLFDPVDAVYDGVVDTVNGDGWYSIPRRLTGEVVSAIPGSSVLTQTFLGLDEDTSKKWFGDTNPARYGNGVIGLKNLTNIVTEVIDGKFTDALGDYIYNFAMPGGGKQTERIVETMQSYGYLPKYTPNSGILPEFTNENFSASGKLQYVQPGAEEDPLNFAKKLAFGKWAGNEEQAYVDNNFNRVNNEKKEAKEETPDKEDNDGYKTTFDSVYYLAKESKNNEDALQIANKFEAVRSLKDGSGKTLTNSASLQKRKILVENGLWEEYKKTYSQEEISRYGIGKTVYNMTDEEFNSAYKNMQNGIGTKTDSSKSNTDITNKTKDNSSSKESTVTTKGTKTSSKTTQWNKVLKALYGTDNSFTNINKLLNTNKSKTENVQKVIKSMRSSKQNSSIATLIKKYNKNHPFNQM